VQRKLRPGAVPARSMVTNVVSMALTGSDRMAVLRLLPERHRAWCVWMDGASPQDRHAIGTGQGHAHHRFRSHGGLEERHRPSRHTRRGVVPEGVECLDDLLGTGPVAGQTQEVLESLKDKHPDGESNPFGNNVGPPEGVECLDDLLGRGRRVEKLRAHVVAERI
jgi:hypothetical protein